MFKIKKNLLFCYLISFLTLNLCEIDYENELLERKSLIIKDPFLSFPFFEYIDEN